jgi:hypothetical protein
VVVLARGSDSNGDEALTEATVNADEVRQSVGLCYCSPQFARVALRLHEAFVRRRYPGVIVIPASDYIRSPG